MVENSWRRTSAFAALVVAFASLAWSQAGEQHPVGTIVTSELSATPALVRHPAGSRLEGAPRSAMAAFFQQHSSQWEVRWDLRSDRPHLVQGAGIPLIPGRGNVLLPETVGLPRRRELEVIDLEPLLRRFMDRFPEMFRVSGSELSLDPSGSSAYGPDNSVWFVEFRQSHGGVPVKGANVFFRVNNGNIVQFGTDLVSDVRIDTVPRLDASAAKGAALRVIGVRNSEIAEVLDGGTLTILPTLRDGEKPGDGYAGPTGDGYRHRLVWEFTFRRRDDVGTYDMIVDANDGRVLQLIDLNAHAQVTGGIYPLTNTDPEEVRGFPFTTVTNNGTKQTDAAGFYAYAGGTAIVNLGGQYIQIFDSCGGISRSSTTDGNLAFGTSAGTDCTTPGIGGTGNTHAARTAFYHLTNINRKAVQYHPSNAWLAGRLTVNTNINDVCDAFWNGSALNFFRSGGGCSNTGELASVLFHEWGHGMDTNTGGAAAELASGEAVGDTFAFLLTRDGCIGQNFLPGVSCHNCENCTGVRDVSDFDLSGPGVIAKPSTIRDNAGIDCDQFPCPFFPGSGPMGYEPHCESQIASSANWDLTQSLIATYGVEPGWAAMEKIWYGSLTPSKSAYRVVSGGQCNSAAVVDGCAATNWYTVYLPVDDDNGSLSDGTPNACRIWDAFNAHGISCGTRPICSGTGPTCGTPVCPVASCTPPLPPPSDCPINTLVLSDKEKLAWDNPSGCTAPQEYDVVRGDLDCLRYTCRPIQQTAPVCLPLEDDDVDSSALDPTAPAPGNGYWYLVRVNGKSWNSLGSKQCTDYDATLPLGCR